MYLNCPSLDTWHKRVPKSGRMATIAGFSLLLICGVGFGTWAAVAPLEGAVVSHGTFVATGQNKQIQHLEGGIIEGVLVREGDRVETGQVLVRLEETTARARLQRLLLRQYRLAISRSRLEAEIESKDSLVTPSILKPIAGEPVVAAMLKRQMIELRARRKKLSTEQEVLRKEIAGLKESIVGYETQLASTRERLELFKEELTDKRKLYDRQLARKSDLLAVQRAEAAINGEVGLLLGRIADARERIARADQQIASLQSAAIQEAVEELRQVESELDDVDEQIRAARDVMTRTKIRSPVDGAIVKINSNTKGGVIAPGDVILELLPLNDELVIQGRISPSEVTQVSTGKSALVRLTAMKQRLTPMVAGEVIYLSPDAVSEGSQGSGAPLPPTHRDSFVVRVRLDQDDPFLKVTEFRPTPGMPADIYIKTEKRTFFEYIMRPVFDSFSRAFRER